MKIMKIDDINIGYLIFISATKEFDLILQQYCEFHDKTIAEVKKEMSEWELLKELENWEEAY